MSEKKSTTVKIIKNDVPVIFCEKLIQFSVNDDIIKLVFAKEITEEKKENSLVENVNLVISLGDFIEHIEFINKCIKGELIDKLIQKNEERKNKLEGLKNKIKK